MIISDPAEIKSIENSFDIVIVGAGPAGLTLSFQLDQLGMKVLLLEGGMENWSQESQDRYIGTITGQNWNDHNYLNGFRLRYLGGTSNHWNGACPRLDKFDLIDWPITYEDLYKNAPIAETILETENYEVIQKEHENKFNFNNKNTLHEPRTVLRSPSIRFKNKYSKIFETSNFPALCLNANLVEIKLNNELQGVSGITVQKKPNSPVIEIQAKSFILCMGAIECTRYMLALMEKYPQKDDWGGKWVGQNFLEHPHFDWDNPVAFCISQPNTLLESGYTNDQKFPANAKYNPILQPKSSTRKNQKILNYAFSIFAARNEIQVTESEYNYYQLIQKSLQKKTAKRPEDLAVHIVNLVTEIDATSSNRIILDHDKRDDLNLPRVNLNIENTELLKRTTKYAVRNLQQDLITHGVVLIKVNEIHDNFTGGAHPMGTTRMGISKTDGVVDSNCKVFGVDNLYICSASVFRSGGYANPTYTLVCLAINLAFHLKAG